MGWKWFLILTASEKPTLLIMSNDVQFISMSVL